MLVLVLVLWCWCYGAVVLVLWCWCFCCGPGSASVAQGGGGGAATHEHEARALAAGEALDLGLGDGGVDAELLQVVAHLLPRGGALVHAAVLRLRDIAIWGEGGGGFRPFSSCRGEQAALKCASHSDSVA